MKKKSVVAVGWTSRLISIVYCRGNVNYCAWCSLSADFDVRARCQRLDFRSPPPPFINSSDLGDLQVRDPEPIEGVFSTI